VVLATGSQSAAESCVVDGRAVVEAAVSNGFGFTAKRTQGERGTCKLDDEPSVVIAAASLEHGPIQCEADFFTGRRLGEGWSLESARFAGAPFRFREARHGHLETPAQRVSFTVEQGGQLTFKLIEVTLAGPDCDDWKDAFSGGTALDDPEEPHPDDDRPDPDDDRPDPDDDDSEPGDEIESPPGD
jgi:hypothetical protein